ncbi:family 16 glycoside hydrolase [Singulisphaera acidiphila]|uniref:Putative peptidase n=1 Tax=Singulisphaera acidiphila (strain ATCC BAA-1392 / DSM 18658 / VKM B-2454 / MOB10) TaxID=886293 RepID=L0DLZ8_SINAD|nr:family 16 glycoside hydrolase [Singulisphaera acidiphila]AGA29711.1 putative peptidase [Singulisphaera acidiphila DSM 18658]
MKRIVLSLAVWAIVAVPSAQAQSTEQPARTASYIEAFQNPDGGFAAKLGGPSTLGSTSSAIRSLKNVGGSIPDVLACVSYVKSCRDSESGGFAPTPGGKPDVRTTAVGLMAVAELLIADEETSAAAIGYFSKNVKDFEDIRIAVAGLESIKKTAPEFAKWTKQIEEMRNQDGTFGQGAGQARDTGGAVAALLRMGVELDKREAVLAALRAGQRSDGAWSKAEGPSDLEATYRIMRAFFMLKEAPDLDAVRGFIDRCRKDDGSYSSAPGGPGDLGGTYYATTVLRWVKILGGEPGLVETVGFVPLFNGKDLTGWEGDTSLWSAREGMLVGTSPGIKHNDFLATEKSYGDFILKFSFRLNGAAGSNSGVQFRSVRIPGHEMSGYQADIGENYWGCLYDESRRNKVLEKASPKALEALHKTGWNHYVIRAIGRKIVITLNGVNSVTYVEPDETIARTGRIGLQIHAGGPMVIQFKDLLIQALPEPTADRPAEPGFHLRTIKTDDGERKYSVSLPPGYDGSKEFPVVMFLHGSGERGDDGIISAQVGLGSAVFGRPEDYPFIAVYPQARKSWKADSEDSKAALAALDDVLKNYKADPKRVALTGLSMGGSGSWDLAAAQPERFVAVVPICGQGEVGSAAKLKSVPVWVVVGDADGQKTVINAREMTQALRDAGAKVHETEYRGVPHNSWDRAYNDPALLKWLTGHLTR